MRTTGLAIDVQRLRRVYPGARRRAGVVALDGVDLSIQAGEVHGLLGPNGAGKTTLCKILATVLLPTDGRAIVAGHDVVRETAAVRRLIGIVFGGERGLYSRLTARSNLEFWAALYGLRGRAGRARVDALLDRFGLAGRADDRVESFSRGMKQRLHLARGLIGDPLVLLLDEPTTGMDPVAAHDFRALVADLRGEGRTVLLTTHDMAEAEAVCDRVTLIDGGRLLATERPATLHGWISTYARIDAREVPPEIAEELSVELRALPGVAAVLRVEPDGLRIETAAAEAAARVLRRLLDAGLTGVTTSRPGLEEVYLQVIAARDEGQRVNALAAGLRIELQILRHALDHLLALVTAPMMTLVFLAITRNAGRFDLAPYAVLAPALIALWGMALLTAGEIVANERDNGSLEALIATPAPFAALITGRIAGVTLVSLAGFAESWGAAWLVFGVAVPIAHPVAFLMTIIATALAMAGTASMMSAVFVLARSARTFQNSLSYPFYLLGGVMVPVALLPDWVRPISRAVFLSWSSDLLRDTLAPGQIVQLLPRLGAVAGLGLAGYLAGVVLLRRAVDRVRTKGSLGHA